MMMLVLCIGITVFYWFSVDFGIKSGYLAVLMNMIVMGGWLMFAIGCPNNVMHNKVIDYLSGISMEIYLSHMMSFRAVQFLHVSDYIHNMHLCYLITCVLTLTVAVCFSHVVKYIVLPKVELTCGKILK